MKKKNDLLDKNKKLITAMKRFKDIVEEYDLDDDQELLIDMELTIEEFAESTG